MTRPTGPPLIDANGPNSGSGGSTRTDFGPWEVGAWAGVFATVDAGGGLTTADHRLTLTFRQGDPRDPAHAGQEALTRTWDVRYGSRGRLWFPVLAPWVSAHIERNTDHLAGHRHLTIEPTRLSDPFCGPGVVYGVKNFNEAPADGSGGVLAYLGVSLGSGASQVFILPPYAGPAHAFVTGAGAVLDIVAWDYNGAQLGRLESVGISGQGGRQDLAVPPAIVTATLTNTSGGTVSYTGAVVAGPA